MPPKAKKLLFASCHFALTGKLSKTRADMTAWIQGYGGFVHGSVNKSVTHVISSHAESTSTKALQAKGLGIPILQEKYLHACVKQGKLLPVDDYVWKDSSSSDDDGDDGDGSSSYYRSSDSGSDSEEGSDSASDGPSQPAKKVKVMPSGPGSKPATMKTVPQPLGTDGSDTESCSGDDGSDEDDGSEGAGDDRPVCPYGMGCYRKNPVHFVEMKHPTAHPSYKPKPGPPPDTAAAPAAAAAADGGGGAGSADSVREDLQRYKELVRESIVGNVISTAMKRKMREFRQAHGISMEEHLAAMQQFGWTAEEYEDGEKRVSEPVLPEERVFLDSASGFGIVYLKKSDPMTTLQESVFARAAAKFYQTMAKAQGGYTVTEVGVIVNRECRARYDAMRAKLLADGVDCTEEWAFHGTGRDAILSIARTGFLEPKQFKSADVKVAVLDSGFFGAGIYFSFYSDYSMYYSSLRQSNQMLLCRVMRGKCFHCKGRMDGKQVKPGYHSHYSPKGNELVIFRADCVLPTFIITFEKTA